MKLLLVLIALALVAGAVYAIYSGFRWAIEKGRAERRATLPWKVTTDNNNGSTVVLLEKPGEPSYHIGSVPISVPHWEFEERLAELRLEAHDKANALDRKF